MKQYKSTFASKNESQQKQIGNNFRIALEKFLFDNKVGMADLANADMLPVQIRALISAETMKALQQQAEQRDRAGKEVVMDQRQPTVNEIYSNVVRELNMTSVRGQNEILANLISKIKKDRTQIFEGTAKALEAAQNNHKESSKSAESLSYILDGTMDLLNIR